MFDSPGDRSQQRDGYTLGVRVMVVLPTYNEAANIERILELVRNHAQVAHILVVDDDENSLKGLASYLENLDYDVLTAKSAEEAITELRRLPSTGSGPRYSRAG